MNLPNSETLSASPARFLNNAQGYLSGFRQWCRSEFEDARFYYIRFRAENGEAVNQFRFGLMYETGHRGLRSDYEAYKWFLRAAYQGHLEAQFKVSDYHLIGRGVTRSEEEAFKWCRKAAEQGHPESQARLARFYQEGVGVERNPKEAKKWQNKATQQIRTPQTLQGELSTC